MFFTVISPQVHMHFRITHSCHVSLVSLNLEQLLSLSLSFMTLTFLKATNQLFCGLSLTWGLSNVSLRLDSGDVFSMGIITEVMRCSFPGIRSGGTLCWFVQLLVMYNIDQLVKDVFTQLIHSKVIIFPFVINRQLVVGLCKHLRSTKLSPLVLASIDNSSDGHQSEILTPTSLPHLLAEIIV